MIEYMINIIQLISTYFKNLFKISYKIMSTYSKMSTNLTFMSTYIEIIYKIM